MYQLVEADEQDARDGGEVLPPADFLYGYAAFCLGRKSDARVETWSLVDESTGSSAGWLVGVREKGKVHALPDRMYGFLPARGVTEIDLDGVYRLLRQEWGGNFRLSLPPVELSGNYFRGRKGKLERYHAHYTFLMQPKNVEDAWNKLERVGRQGVRKAEQSGLIVSDAHDSGAIMRYLGLHVSTTQRRASPAMERNDISRLQELFGEGVGLRIASLDGKPVAAVLFVQVGEYVMLVDNASLREYWKLNPNNLVIWEAIRGCVRRGARVIDYGFSEKGDEGGMRFKRHLGGTPAMVYGVSSG